MFQHPTMLTVGSCQATRLTCSAAPCDCPAASFAAGRNRWAIRVDHTPGTTVALACVACEAAGAALLPVDVGCCRGANSTLCCGQQEQQWAVTATHLELAVRGGVGRRGGRGRGREPERERESQRESTTQGWVRCVWRLRVGVTSVCVASTC